jgi:hypothetical protein
MKEFFNKFVNDYREDGFTASEWMIGGLFIASVMALCLLAEIINAI